MRMLHPLSTPWTTRRESVAPLLMVSDVFEDFDRIAERWVPPRTASNVADTLPCEIEETPEHYLLSFDMPGVKREDIKIEIRGMTLMLQGERWRETKQTYRKFERAIELPASVDASGVEAHYEDGVLRVVLPKASAPKGRTIEIQTGEGGFLSKNLGAKKDGLKELNEVKSS